MTVTAEQIIASARAQAGTGSPLDPNGTAANPRPPVEPVDLKAVLDGTAQPIAPAIGTRDDGVHLLYPGRSHTMVGESEAAKSWLALTIAAEEINAGHDVNYLDFEDDEYGITGRLVTLGASDEAILACFRYYRPEAGFTRADAAGVIERAPRARLTVVDGVTEAMVLNGLDPLALKDIPAYVNAFVLPFTRAGQAAVSLDHVSKAQDNKRYSIGSVHKLNAVTGAAYVIENREPFGIGLTGKSTIRIAKDRPGQLRRHSLPGRDNLRWFGDFVLASRDETFAEASIPAPRDHGADPPFRPTELMAKLSRYIEKHPGLSQNALLGAVSGRASYKTLALELLRNEGYVTTTAKGQSRLHHNARPYTGDDQ